MSDRLIRYNDVPIEATSTPTANKVVEWDASKGLTGDALTATLQLVVNKVIDFKGKAVTASETVDSSVTFYEVDATSALVELTLPAVATVPGRAFILTKTDSGGNAAKFKGSGGTELINGTNLYSTSTQYATLRVRANTAGTAWYGW